MDGVGEVEIVEVATAGDVRAEVPISSFAATGVFVVEVERAVLEGAADVAVHSAKDLPAGEPPRGLVLASVPDRQDARDALVGSTLARLAPGATVATGAVRRRAQLAAARPDLSFAELRGNIATRLSRVPSGGAVVVALAALRRLGLEARADEVLSSDVVLPQVGQGALALRCRQDDRDAIDRVEAIDDVAAHRAVRAERAFLAHLGGGCDAPVGAHAVLLDPGEPLGELVLDGLLASEDGRTLLRRRAAGSDPEALGTALAKELAATDAGAGLLAGGWRQKR